MILFHGSRVLFDGRHFGDFHVTDACAHIKLEILVLIETTTWELSLAAVGLKTNLDGQIWTRCVRFGQSQKKLAMSASHKPPQESSREVKSHKIVTLWKSSHKGLPMRQDRHISLCDTHGPTYGRTDRRTYWRRAVPDRLSSADYVSSGAKKL